MVCINKPSLRSYTTDTFEWMKRETHMMQEGGGEKEAMTQFCECVIKIDYICKIKDQTLHSMSAQLITH